MVSYHIVAGYFEVCLLVFDCVFSCISDIAIVILIYDPQYDIQYLQGIQKAIKSN